MPNTNRPTLRKGDGIKFPDLKDDVKALQELLQAQGFLHPNSSIDGLFGKDTETAVKQFQRSNGLLVDGIAGADTWSALLQERVESTRQHAVMVGNFDVDKIVDSIAFATIRASARESVPLILQECSDSGVADKRHIAYILATAQHESHLGRLMVEQASGFKYEPTSRLSKDLGNKFKGDGPKFKGRGFVQITGRTNYSNWAERLSVDLVNHPEQAAEPTIAAKILVRGMRDGSYTGVGLSQFIKDGKTDFVNARKIVNSLDRADEIAAIAQSFLKVL